MAAERLPATPATSKPHFGHTRHGMAVHLHTHDHMRSDTAYARFNKRCAVWVTTRVGTMTACWIFTVLAALVIPSCLHTAGYISANYLGHFLGFTASFGFNLLATLILSTWLELALMPAIMVGQNLAAAAADARAAKQFEDTEEIVDLLNMETQGGLNALYAKLHADIESLRQ